MKEFTERVAFSFAGLAGLLFFLSCTAPPLFWAVAILFGFSVFFVEAGD